MHNNPINLIDPTGMSAEGPGDGLGPNSAPAGEIAAKKGETKYLKSDGNGVKVMGPDGKYHNFDSKISKYTYSDGKFHNGQQKKEGVWSVTNKEGNFMWDNTKGEFVANKSDRGGGENSFPSLGKMGTTYAGGDNPKSKNGSSYDYSQPPQNIADFIGYIHDREYDTRQLEGVDGTLSPLSTPANKRLIDLSKQVILMYRKGMIDPYTGAPVSKLTHDTAVNMIRAFEMIEAVKK